MLTAFPEDFTIIYLNDEQSVNDTLSEIVDGVVGFDTEYVARIPTWEEAIIEHAFSVVPGSKKSALLGWQLIEAATSDSFTVAWDNIGLCVVQIARDNMAWVINIRSMKAFPSELKRVLTSPNIVKAGVGLLNDMHVLWRDIRIELKQMVDVGLMARLLLAPSFGDTAFSNLSMQETAAYILHCRVDKADQTSDWKGRLSDSQIKCEGYRLARNMMLTHRLRDAAIDAVASLRIYSEVAPALFVKGEKLGKSIPAEWYSFNSTYGEPMRTTRNIHSEEVAWSVKDCPWWFSNKFQGYFY
ncbi:ribonuclease H-like domain-containing protein [Mycena rebaudengoi]|nr:ribonuclease H-like domain-containing protein [Mycena rebaudengoi]